MPTPWIADIVKILFKFQRKTYMSFSKMRLFNLDLYMLEMTQGCALVNY